MMKIKFCVSRSSSATNPPPPLPSPLAVAGGQSSVSASYGGRGKRCLDVEGSGAGGPALPSNSILLDQNLHQTHGSQIHNSLAVGDGFIQWPIRKKKSRCRRRATPQPSGFVGGSSSGEEIRFRPYGTVGFPIYRRRYPWNSGDNRMFVGGSPLTSRTVLGKRPRSAAEKTERKKAPSSSGGPSKKHKPNNSSAQPQKPKSSNRGVAAEVANPKKGSGVVAGPPGIVIGLTKEEKEEDFLTMIGAELPRKPKRRSKNVEIDLLYCFPGMFLSDVSRSKYKVVEKKRSRKSRRRGLKGIVESSDSE